MLHVKSNVKYNFESVFRYFTRNGETLKLKLEVEPEPENPKDKNAISVIKDSQVVAHMPLRLANTNEGSGLLRHFLAKPGTSGIV